MCVKISSKKAIAGTNRRVNEATKFGWKKYLKNSPTPTHKHLLKHWRCIILRENTQIAMSSTYNSTLQTCLPALGVLSIGIQLGTTRARFYYGSVSQVRHCTLCFSSINYCT